MKRVLLVVCLGVVGSSVGWAGAESFSVHGRVSATEQEAQEGYFAIDDQTMVVVKPGSELHTYLRSRTGQRVRITIEPDRQSE